MYSLKKGEITSGEQINLNIPTCQENITDMEMEVEYPQSRMMENAWPSSLNLNIVSNEEVDMLLYGEGVYPPQYRNHERYKIY